MGEQPLILSIDIGTSNCSVSLFTINGKKIHETKRNLSIISPSPGFFEHNPKELWISVKTCVKNITRKFKEKVDSIVAVGIAGHMPSPIPIDKNGTPLMNCILHLDTRAKPQVEKTLRKIEENEIYLRTGIRPNATYSGFKYLWIKENKPNVYRKTYKFLEPASFVALKLTGEIGIDETHAGGTMLYNIHKRKWDAQLIDALNMDIVKLPSVFFSTKVVGEISGKTMDETGLAKGTQVAVGVVDSFSATFGTGVHSPETLCDISGSTTCLNTVVNKPVLDKEMRFTCYPFIFQDKWILDATFTSGIIVDNFLKNLGIGYGKERLYEHVEKILKNTEIGSGKMLFFPFTGMGEQSPYWDPCMKTVLIGWSPGKKLENIVRALYEGLTYAIKLNVDVFYEKKLKIREVISSGGGAKSREWCQMKADVLNLPVKVPSEVSTTSLGAAIIAGIATKTISNWKDVFNRLKEEYKTYKPDKKRHKKYMQFYTIFKEIYPSVSKIFHLLAEI
ncbi:MAG: xylulokinase [Candidatus Baldrarchaeia archaeon]